MSQEIFELLRADNTIHVNRTLAAAIGLNEAVIYSALLGKEYYYKSVDQLDNEGMFYATATDLTERTTLTQRQQDRAVTHLEELELISTKLKGMPARKYFKINPDTEIVAALLREKIKHKPPRNQNKNNGGGNSSSGSESGGGTPGNTEQNEDEASFNKMSKQESTEQQTLLQQNVETSFNKMSKQDSTEQETLFQQNVETSLDKTLKQDSTKSESMDQQKSETIININNNNNINK